MLLASKKFILACMLVSCVNKIHSLPKTKFSFRKTFLTPREIYEKRNEELDQCEILERSNFSSDEDDDKPAKPNHDIPNVIANAQIHVRIGEDTDPEPTIRNEKFIEMPRRGAQAQKGQKIQKVSVVETDPEDDLPTHQEWFLQPKAQDGGCGCQPAPSCHGCQPAPSCHGCPPAPSCHGCPPVFPPYNPYYHVNPYMNWNCPVVPPWKCGSGCGQCQAQTNRPCVTQTTPKPTTNPESEVTEVPFIYFFTRDDNEEVPSAEKIRNQPIEELTDEQLALIKEFLNIGDELGEKESIFIDEPSATTLSVNPSNGTGPTTVAPTGPTTVKAPARNCPTIQPCPCVQTPAPGPFIENVLLTKIEQPSSCSNVSGGCQKLSENVQFLNLDLTDLINATCLNSTKRRGSKLDMDDLVRVRGEPSCNSSQIFQQPCHQPYPYPPPFWNPWFNGPGFYPFQNSYGGFNPVPPPFIPPPGFHGV